MNRQATNEVATLAFFAATPLGAPALEIGEEFRSIEHILRTARFRDQIVLRPWFAARPEDLLRALPENVSILHFSGHGAGSPGLCFHGSNVSTEALVQVARASEASLKVILLNACYSNVQAEHVVTSVPCIIAMSGVIADEAAIQYSTWFYYALASGRSVANAHQYGLAALELRSTRGP